MNSSIDDYSFLFDLTIITILGLSEPGSDGNEGVPYIPQSCTTGESPSDGLVSYPGDCF